jgi:hypothetical protein
MAEETEKGFWDGAEVIYAYTRAQALEDGVLVDVSEIAKQSGIKFRVALTSTVWGQYVAVPEGVQCQDETGRLWDVLLMFRTTTLSGRIKGDIGTYQLYVRNHNRERLTKADLVTLKAVCGPGDTPEPVITIMLPDED